jgi:hypothetical protein
MDLEADYEAIRGHSKRIVRQQARKYARSNKTPFTSSDDLEQEVWVRLWEWIQVADAATIEALRLNAEEAQKFLNTFSRCRICDYLDLLYCGKRDQNLTVHASRSHSIGQHGGVGSGLSLLEYLDTRASTAPSEVIEILDCIRGGLSSAAVTLLELLVDPPASIHEAFLVGRTRQLTGTVTRKGSSVELTRENDYIDLPEISWDGPLREGSLRTNFGEADVHIAGPWTTIAFQCGLVIELEGDTGKFSMESVRPSQAWMDEYVIQDYLGWGISKTRHARAELQEALTAILEPQPS